MEMFSNEIVLIVILSLFVHHQKTRHVEDQYFDHLETENRTVVKKEREHETTEQHITQRSNFDSLFHSDLSFYLNRK